MAWISDVADKSFPIVVLLIIVGPALGLCLGIFIVCGLAAPSCFAGWDWCCSC